jgi:hypothetical protein
MAKTTTVTMIERMYWEHGYSEEQIANRLRADPRVVRRIVSKDYVEIQHWDEDNNRYTVERQQRERKTPLRTEGETMIFPDLPKRIDWTRADSIEAAEAYTAKTPLHCTSVEYTVSKDPAALVADKQESKKIDWLAKDAWELYAIIVGMLAWCVYWLGIHRGAW